jgi:hypothetical protein
LRHSLQIKIEKIMDLWRTTKWNIVTKHIGNKNKGCFVKTLAGVTYGPWATKISIIFSSKQTLVQFISLSLSLSQIGFRGENKLKILLQTCNKKNLYTFVWATK